MRDIFELQNPWMFEKPFVFPKHKRLILPELLSNVDNSKMLGLVGSRQVGKSSLLYLIIQSLLHQGTSPRRLFYFNLDHMVLHPLFENLSEFISFLNLSTEKRSYVFIDEIQRLKEPGLFLKSLHDLQLNLKVFFSGSSQLEIRSKLKEHGAGRFRLFEIPRLTFEEYQLFRHPISPTEALQEYLIYGGYPEVALTSHHQEKILLLRDIYLNYLQKDVTDLLKIDNTHAFNQMATLLAAQSGSLLNIESLSKAIKIKRSEVERYLSILEGTFIIKRLYPYYKNYKKEITKTPKVYWLDLGLRNYQLSAFLPFEVRNDQGALFENFHFLELLAADPYGLNKIHYWRSTNQTEIDFIIQSETELSATEVKWSSSATPKAFQTFLTYYPETSTQLINREHYLGTKP